LVNRRDFLKICAAIGTAATIELYSADIRDIFTQAIEVHAQGDNVRVIWLAGAQDTGCTVSLLQGSDPDLIDVITKFRLQIDFHQTLMIPEGEAAMKRLEDVVNDKSRVDVLIMEGAIPEGYFCTVGEIDGQPVPIEDWVKQIGGRAKYNIAVGQCAAYGGIPAAKPNPTNCRSLSEVLPDKTVINIPGCPPNPDWMTLAFAQALQGLPIELDDVGRPAAIFKETVHEGCPLLGYYEEGVFAKTLDGPGCLYKVGCKGPLARADCTVRRWNQGLNSCTTAGGCKACVEKGWPDEPFAPFYEEAAEIPPSAALGIDPILIAGAATGAAAVGAVAYAEHRRRKHKKESKKEIGAEQ